MSSGCVRSGAEAVESPACRSRRPTRCGRRRPRGGCARWRSRSRASAGGSATSRSSTAIDLAIPAGARVLVAGVNPEAPSLLLRIMAGLARADRGSVAARRPPPRGGHSRGLGAAGRVRRIGSGHPAVDDAGGEPRARRPAGRHRRAPARPPDRRRAAAVPAGRHPRPAAPPRGPDHRRADRAGGGAPARSGGPPPRRAAPGTRPAGSAAAARIPGERRTVLIASRFPAQEGGIVDRVVLIRDGRIALHAPDQGARRAAAPLSLRGMTALADLAWSARSLAGRGRTGHVILGVHVIRQLWIQLRLLGLLILPRCRLDRGRGRRSRRHSLGAGMPAGWRWPSAFAVAAVLSGALVGTGFSRGDPVRRRRLARRPGRAADRAHRGMAGRPEPGRARSPTSLAGILAGLAIPPPAAPSPDPLAIAIERGGGGGAGRFRSRRPRSPSGWTPRGGPRPWRPSWAPRSSPSRWSSSARRPSIPPAATGWWPGRARRTDRSPSGCRPSVCAWPWPRWPGIAARRFARRDL